MPIALWMSLGSWKSSMRSLVRGEPRQVDSGMCHLPPKPGVWYRYLLNPSLPRSMRFDEIYKDPAAHVKLLQPWLDGKPVSSLRDMGQFTRQLECWKDFRRWQRVNRGLSIVSEEDFASLLDEWRREMESKGFDKPFKLLENAETQDDRTTWVEYLQFECWSLDLFTISAQPKQGAKEPLESGVSKNRKSSQELRVQWILSKMPPDPKAPQSNTGVRSKTTMVMQGKQKRKLGDEEQAMGRDSDEAPDRRWRDLRRGHGRAERTWRKNRGCSEGS
ncbi:hypothetical protein F4778DRAFT_786534 [Xylariomycetidae sp. FL2044]|nr:hypothetical protein F4778DRAFT_786534 [Xylariomycetidae sp. FL2044]